MKIKDILLDAAQCLDDCLIRIYPEEFTKKDIENSAQRFSEGRGTIARIADTADALRKLYAEKEGANQAMLNALAEDLQQRFENGAYMPDYEITDFIRNWRRPE